jgi:2-oxo-4-hydroxy-4-carboxy-5-ureidoimidazoline decarboxylase
MTATPLSLAQLNSMDRATFIAALGGIYERSPWVAEAASKSRPFASREALEHTLQQFVIDAGRARQLDLLRLHPTLGTRLELSGYSRAEQAGAGLQKATAEERAELERLNREYERKFGFPFILAVRNASLGTILASCRERIGADADAEFAESLRQVFKIAGFRIADLL